jgi:hypothetical protein
MAKRRESGDQTNHEAPAQDRPKRAYIQAPITVDPGVPCVHCGHRYGHLITNTYPNGNRRRICGGGTGEVGGCGKPFVTARNIDPPQP